MVKEPGEEVYNVLVLGSARATSEEDEPADGPEEETRWEVCSERY